MTPKEKNIAEARVWCARIRKELAEVEDVLDHAAEVRGWALLDSLRKAYEHASSAVLHAVQCSTRKTQ